jgi:recombinational DNA repair protein RecR
MSDHMGSHMLNEVLQLLEQRSVFEQMGRQAAQQLVLDIVRLSNRYDCNPGEILDEIGERLAICSYCLSAKPDVREGLCGDCRTRDTWT